MAAPGLELLYEVASPEIKRPQDALVCFIHWELISSGFRCLGTGEQASPQEREGSEKLPDGWASNKELYTLRYQSGQSKALLKVLLVQGTILVNLMESQTEKVADLTLNMEDFIDATNLQSFHSVYKNPKELHQQIQSKLLSSLLRPKETRRTPERAEHPPEHDPLRVPTRNPPRHPPTWEDPSGHFPYGAADLDPLGRSSGGMIFDPLHSGRTRPRPDPLGGLPLGAVPPGARFDPIGPPGAHRPGPDPDHLPPPGYDDMFM
ncbi:proteasome inhibitor PI31 subunit [Gastrophryne carolinensis]